MTVAFILRFDFRNPAFAGTTQADRFDAALDMAEWADRLGCLSIAVSEHHGSPDEYLPSPLPILAAMAARTTNVRLSVAALIAPFYDPIRLAEDMLVLDHLSRGRVDLIIGGGYLPEEFATYGVPIRERVPRVVEAFAAIRGAFSGEPFELRGRQVQLTPRPYRDGSPNLALGGSSEPAARRAAHIADGFIPSVPEVYDHYRDEMTKLGHPDPGPFPLGENRVVALAEDADAGWEAMGPYFMHEMNAYAAWQDPADPNPPYHRVDTLDELRASGQYAVLTPDELIAELRDKPFPFASFHPLCGGTPPDLAWSSLTLFEQAVLPAFA